MKFPFDDAPNTAVITCCHILDKQKPILYVSHDADDGMWQFLCGGLHEESEGRIVSLYEIYRQDSSIALLADLPCGSAAKRLNASARWNRSRARKL